MKHLLFKKALLVAILLSGALVISNCKKTDPEYKVVVTVKYLSDTLKVVPDAAVVIEKNDRKAEGITDAGGQFTTVFKYEMILNVHANIDTGQAGNPHLLYGNSTVRLLADKTVYRTVFVSP